MLYREMPKTGDKLSILGFGCMRLPGGQMSPDEEESIKQIRSSIDRGINYVDTAWPYHGGKSEVILGKALKDGYREKVKIADKLPIWMCHKRDDMDYFLDEQLKRLDVKQIDYYLIHALDGPTWKKAMELGVIDFLDKAKESGKIAHAGFSFHGAREDFKGIIDDYSWEFCQIQYNILDEQVQAGKEGLDYAYSKNIGVIIMEPLRGGMLAGEQPREVQKIYDTAPVKRTNVEWSLRWLWNHEGIITVLSGMNNEDHIAENLKIASEAEIDSLTEEELGIVKSASEAFRKAMKIPCTGCQYCMPCPKGINIPQAFSFYNNKYLFKTGMTNKMMYLMFSGGTQKRDPGLASQCISCGKCVTHCPQKIDIPAELNNVKNEFEGFMTPVWVWLLDKMISMGGR
jgi:predicted aldo/keto reductase-like oxidoreductase